MLISYKELNIIIDPQVLIKINRNIMIKKYNLFWIYDET